MYIILYIPETVVDNTCQCEITLSTVQQHHVTNLLQKIRKTRLFDALYGLDVWSYKFMYTNIHFRPHRKQRVSITTTNREIIAILRGQNAQFSYVKADGTYIYHCTLKSNLSYFKLNYITWRVGNAWRISFLHSGSAMYSVLCWILPARFRCMYMLAVVTGGGARYAVPLYKYAEPWLHACPVTYINTYIPHGHQDCSRYVRSGTEPQCFYP
jgi:hypothetical protein